MVPVYLQRPTFPLNKGFKVFVGEKITLLKTPSILSIRSLTKMPESTTFINTHIFTDTTLLPPSCTLTITDSRITSIGTSVTSLPSDSIIIDGHSTHTLLPGLIDAHTHPKIPNLATALKFGVTTELEMMDHWPPEQREEFRTRRDVADLRTADFGLTAKGGHPSELHEKVKKAGEAGGPPPGAPGVGRGGPPPPHGHGNGEGESKPSGGGPGRFVAPTVGTAEEAAEFVTNRIQEGADYIKIMIEEGRVLKSPGLRVLPNEVLKA